MFSKIKDGGKTIHKLLKGSNKILKVSQGLPDWKAYVDFVNNIVVDGLAKVVIASLNFIEQTDPEILKKKDKFLCRNRIGSKSVKSGFSQI